ncbi:MAG: cytochrome D ubiquinol oxidase subunit II, partial [Planctomycetota bacterium]
MLPVVLLDQTGGDYWKHFHSFVTDTLLADGMISPEDLALYKVTDSVQEAVDETLHFYRVYHSMRYVGDTLVLRIRQPLTAEQLDALNEEFSDILTSGRIEQGPALGPESNEPEIAHLPRLTLHFDRKQLGRLRMLINAINNTCPDCDIPSTSSS